LINAFVLNVAGYLVLKYGMLDGAVRQVSADAQEKPGRCPCRR